MSSWSILSLYYYCWSSPPSLSYWGLLASNVLVWRIKVVSPVGARAVVAVAFTVAFICFCFYFLCVWSFLSLYLTVLVVEMLLFYLSLLATSMIFLICGLSLILGVIIGVGFFFKSFFYCFIFVFIFLGIANDINKKCL